MIRDAFGAGRRDSVVVGWLPLYHDMGLIGSVLQPLYVGRPLRADVAGRLPAAAGALAARRSPATARHHQRRPELRLRPVRAQDPAGASASGLDLSSLAGGVQRRRAGAGRRRWTRFADAFAPCGFRREAFYPCYGLAEATLFVSGGRRRAEPALRALRRGGARASAAGGPAAGAPAARTLVGCGARLARSSGSPSSIRRRGAALPAGRVGEIWVRGPSVAAGLLGAPEETARDLRRRDSADGARALPAHRRPRLRATAASCSSPAGSRT